MNSTISQDINEGISSPRVHSKFNYSASFSDSKGDTVVVNYKGIIDEYLHLLKSLTYDYEMTVEEYQGYEYNPKYFCMNKYGNKELWSMLLAVNDMYSIIDFKKRKIKMFPENIEDLIDEILIKEESRLTGMSQTFK